jgi:hypothetical protein
LLLLLIHIDTMQPPEPLEHTRLASLMWDLRSQVTELSQQLEQERQQLQMVRRERAILRRKLDDVRSPRSSTSLHSATVSGATSNLALRTLRSGIGGFLSTTNLKQHQHQQQTVDVELGVMSHRHSTAAPSSSSSSYGDDIGGLLSFLRICLRQIESGLVEESVTNLRSIIDELRSLEPTKPIGGWPPPRNAFPYSYIAVATDMSPPPPLSSSSTTSVASGSTSTTDSAAAAATTTTATALTTRPVVQFMNVEADVLVGTLSLGSFAASESGRVKLTTPLLSTLPAPLPDILKDMDVSDASVTTTTTTTTTTVQQHDPVAAGSLPASTIDIATLATTASTSSADTAPTNQRLASDAPTSDAAASIESLMRAHDLQVTGLGLVVKRQAELSHAHSVTIKSLELQLQQQCDIASQLREQLQQAEANAAELREQLQLERTPAPPPPTDTNHVTTTSTTRNESNSSEHAHHHHHHHHHQQQQVEPEVLPAPQHSSPAVAATIDEQRDLSTNPEPLFEPSASQQPEQQGSSDEDELYDLLNLEDALAIVHQLEQRLEDLQVVHQLSEIESVNEEEEEVQRHKAVLAHGNALRPDYLKHRRTRSRSLSPAS